VFTFAAVKLGLNTYTISNALKDSWEFVKRRFILSIVFIIFLMVFIYIIYYLVDFLYSVIFFYNEPASLIIRSILYLVIILYSTNALVLFVEKYSK
jgi:membrane-anchored glycerophosphoryl diester phosphodiesterase (GDPDase)